MKCAACVGTRPPASTTTCWAVKAARASSAAVSSRVHSTSARMAASVRWTCTCVASVRSAGCASARRRACGSSVSAGNGAGRNTVVLGQEGCGGGLGADGCKEGGSVSAWGSHVNHAGWMLECVWEVTQSLAGITWRGEAVSGTTVVCWEPQPCWGCSLNTLFCKNSWNMASEERFATKIYAFFSMLSSVSVNSGFCFVIRTARLVTVLLERQALSFALYWACDRGQGQHHSTAAVFVQTRSRCSL